MLLKRSSFAVWAMSAACTLVSCGCTSLRDYVGNNFKVGPEYETPTAPVAGNWIDANDVRLRSETGDLSSWWSVFDDPLLNNIMVDAYQQNLTLREAGFRVLAARAQYGIAVGNLFPQQQNMGGGYTRRAVQNIYSENWDMGFNMAWELDFWGRFRRSIISAEDTLDASVFNYDDVIVTLLGDVASAYVQIRTQQRRIELLENVIAVQQDVYNFIDLRLREGFSGVTELDKAQAESDLKQSRASVAQLRIDLRTTENGLCALLGRPSVDLEPWLAMGPKRGIPIPPDYAVVGVPADLLRRRPDVRRAERNAAAQAEQIGVATSDLYPSFSITGSLGWQNSQLDQLVKPGSFNGFVGPQFQWNLLNYGRLLNNIRLQDAQFNGLVAFYQNTVVNASAEAENGIVTFLVAQDRARLLGESVDAAYRALAVIVAQYEAGLQGVDFNRYAVILQSLVSQQDQWAVSQGQIGQGLIQVYRALGGGWEIRLGDNANVFRNLPPVINIPAFAPEEIPASEAIAPPVSSQPPSSESNPADQLPAVEGAPSVVPLQPINPFTPPAPGSAPAPLPPAPSDAAPADQIPPSPTPESSPGAATASAEELPSVASRRLPQSMADVRSSRRRGR
jgi:NodT family efflux transporter outer membrane factor (OMF) lipoprotein